MVTAQHRNLGMSMLLSNTFALESRYVAHTRRALIEQLPLLIFNVPNAAQVVAEGERFVASCGGCSNQLCPHVTRTLADVSNKVHFHCARSHHRYMRVEYVIDETALPCTNTPILFLTPYLCLRAGAVRARPFGYPQVSWLRARWRQGEPRQRYTAELLPGFATRLVEEKCLSTSPFYRINLISSFQCIFLKETVTELKATG
jgi:hypothetical protein